MYMFFFFVCALVVLLDRFTKEFALAFLYGQAPIELIPQLLYLQFAWNSGAAFGLFHSYQWAITFIVIGIILVLFYSLSQVSTKYFFALSLIIGGAIGNLVDRLIYTEGVIDFFAIPFFAIFNIADIAVTAGVIILILQKETRFFTLLQKRKKKRTT